MQSQSRPASEIQNPVRGLEIQEADDLQVIFGLLAQKKNGLEEIVNGGGVVEGAAPGRDRLNFHSLFPTKYSATQECVH
jgi:hypothetical protein